MMIFIWMGAFLLFVIAATKSQELLQEATATLRKKWHQDLLSKDFWIPVKASVLLGMTSASVAKSEAIALQLFNLRILPKRAALLKFCFSGAGVLVPLLLGFFYLKVNGLLIVGVLLTLGLVLGNFKRTIYSSAALKILIGIGVFYFLAESLLRQNSVFQTVLGTSEFAYLFIDRRGFALLFMLILGMVKSFFIPVSGWTFWFALALVPIGTVSLPSALCFLAGELIFQSFWLWWKLRKTNSESVSVAKVATSLQILGTVVGLFCVLILVDFLQWGGFAAGNLHQLVFELLISVAGIYFFRTAFVSAWGHLASRHSEQEMQEPRYVLLNSSLRYDDPEGTSLIEEGLSRRLNEIKYYQSGLQNQNLVPEMMRLRVEKELLALTELKQKLR